MPATSDRWIDAAPRRALQLVVCGADSRRVEALLAALIARGEVSLRGEAGAVVHALRADPPLAGAAAGNEPTEALVQFLAADIALVLVEAGVGLTDALRRHLYLLSQSGQRPVVFALLGGPGERFEAPASEAVAAECVAAAEAVGLDPARVVPVAEGNASAMPWHRGPDLPACLRMAAEAGAERASPFRMVGRWVGEGADSRFVGTILSGRVARAHPLVFHPSGRRGTVQAILTAGGGREEAVARQAIALTLAQIEPRPGDDSLASAADAPLEIADQFEAILAWGSSAPLLPGRPYRAIFATGGTTATVTAIKGVVDPQHRERLAARSLAAQVVAVCTVSLTRPMPFAPARSEPAFGHFRFVDTDTGATLGIGLIRFALRRAHNIHVQALDVDKTCRAAAKGHRPAILWFTGLSGAGKSTIANVLERRLCAQGCHTYLLDGDNVRHGLNRDLGFTAADRVENIRRVAEVSRLMADAGLIVIAALIAPFRAERAFARSLVPPGEFFEVHVDAPLAVAEARDPKGLYRKARQGALQNFTGIDSPYEAPQDPEIRIDTTTASPDEAAERILAVLRREAIIDD